MTEPLNGKDAMDLAVMVLVAAAAQGGKREVPLSCDWSEIVQRATLLRDRGDLNGYLTGKVEYRGTGIGGRG
jgi:hypothetical protein